jgi:hypothetical protein
MKPVFSLIFSLFTLLAMAQESEVRNVGSFSGIKAAEGIDVYLKKGDKESVKVEVTGTRISNVITEISGSYLKIHMREGNYRNNDVDVYVTYVNLEKLSCSSAANVFSEEVIRADELEMSVSSAGSIDIKLEAGEVEVDASSSGEAELQGKVRFLRIDVSSAGEVDAYDLEAEKVSVNASSAGTAKVNAVKELEAEASSAGSIRYRGNPARSITNASSGGSVKKSN